MRAAVRPLSVLVVFAAVVPGGGPACGPSCTPGESRCNAGAAEICGRDGTWTGTSCLLGDASADAARWPTAGCVMTSSGAATCTFSATRVAACGVAGKLTACVGDAVVACVDGFPTVGTDVNGMTVYRVCAAGACVDTATSAACST